MSPGTEFARDFCAGIGPLQLGVVLVCVCFLRVPHMHHVLHELTLRLTRNLYKTDFSLLFDDNPTRPGRIIELTG